MKHLISKKTTSSYLQSTAEGPIITRVVLIVVFVLDTSLFTSRVHFWFESGRRPRTSPGLAGFGLFSCPLIAMSLVSYLHFAPESL